MQERAEGRVRLVPGRPTIETGDTLRGREREKRDRAEQVSEQTGGRPVRTLLVRRVFEPPVCSVVRASAAQARERWLRVGSGRAGGERGRAAPGLRDSQPASPRAA
jgi:hypothetical protein